MKCMNDMVAVKPITLDHLTNKNAPTAGTRLFITDRMKNELVASEAIADFNDRIKTGDTLYFRAEVSGLPTFRQVLNVEGQEFILLPAISVVLVKEKK